ncbi:serine/threonine-protein kinase [Corallococcus carmarthensis]|uniref:PEGA domain-containing protein n=1 Tax=Corallococcus carmarthensis TaxID=2316728 RepID=A0A3A8K1S8_9BACT|nr:serine/threonine-protein kinase [Corallococcus carmarthensis]RKG98020.1 PEGA domain-containing protein [Corallococcus carmarthensis]
MTTGAHTTRFGKYELQERLGAGGMAVVHRARYTVAEGVSRSVVIKRVRDPYALDPAFVQMFLNEARISMGLSHGNIVQVFDFGQEEGEYFLAMEWVDGQPLSKLLKRLKLKGMAHLPAPLAVQVMVEVCKGLHHAHTRRDEQGRPLGLVHRDVSPDNVLVSYEGEVKLTDFGIAKAQLAGRPETEAGVVRGKFLYLSPEQTRAEALDARSDVYTAGVVLFEMLTGRRPAEGDTGSVMERIATGDLTPTQAYVPDLDPSLGALVSRALALRRDDRFTSAEDFQRALAEWLAYRAPLFPASTLRHLIGWLFEEELKLAGQPPRIPESFLRQVAVWTGEEGPGGMDEPERASSVHRAHETAFPNEHVPGALTGSGTEAASGGLPGWVWAAFAAVAVLFFVVQALLSHQDSPQVRPLQVVSSPPGAEVRWDGKQVGTTPMVLKVVPGEASHQLALRFVGYQPWVTTVSQAAVPERVQVTLERLPPPPPAPEPVVEPRVKDGPQDSVARKRIPMNARSEARDASGWMAQSADAGAAYTLGQQLLVAGKALEAGEKFWKCLELKETAAECHLGLGRVGVLTDRDAMAREGYQRYLGLRPRGPGAAEARKYLNAKAAR